jgi:HAD superfamily hydrolase (TIGR01509 family)
MSPPPLGRARALAFDLDGTLVLTEAAYRDSLAAAAGKLGRTIPWERYDSDLRGRPLAEICRALFPDEQVARRCLAEAREHFWRRSRVRVAPGVRRFLRECAAWPRAVATSADAATAHRLLETARLAEQFSIVVTADDVGPGRTKPHADLYHRAAQRMGVEPDQCTAFEDSAAGALAARRAGMRVIVVGASPAFDGPADRRVRDFRQLRAVALLA